MNWKPVSDPPEKPTYDLLVWSLGNWDMGSYSKATGFQSYDGVVGEYYQDDRITHYLLVEPPSPR